MKKALFVISVLSVAIFSCSKQEANRSNCQKLDGSWKMISVKDNHSAVVSTKPSSVLKDVLITFSPASATSGTFTGYTPTNDLSQSQYLTGSSQELTVLNLAMTKVAETSWGKEFVDNIRDAQRYSFENNGNLDIKTAAKVLIFQRQ